MNERMLCAVKTFLTEHTLFPVQFKFKDEDVLESCIQALKDSEVVSSIKEE